MISKRRLPCRGPSRKPEDAAVCGPAVGEEGGGYGMVSAGSSTAAVRGNTAPRSAAGPRSAATPPRTRPRRLPAGGSRSDPLHPGPGGGAGDGCRRRRGLRDVCLTAWLRSVRGRARLRCHQVRGGKTKSRSNTMTMTGAVPRHRLLVGRPPAVRRGLSQACSCAGWVLPCWRPSFSRDPSSRRPRSSA